MCRQFVTSCPVVFYMLKELGVPALVELVGVPPVHHELRQQADRVVRVDVGHAEDIENVFRGLPVFRDATGLGIVGER